MEELATLDAMAKKKNGGKPTAPAPDGVAVLYVEIPTSLKQQMVDLAKKHNRKITGEVIQAFQEYIARQQTEE